MIPKACNHNLNHFVALFCRKSKVDFQLQLCSCGYNSNGHQFGLSQMEGDNMRKHSQSN
jgi:hypothetical protein